jgi:hypothetical protein
MFNWKEIRKLQRNGLAVQEYTVYHYRVANRFDVFPNDRGRQWAWHDIVTGERGVKPSEQLEHFIPNYLAANPVPQRELIPEREAGWWTCMGCGKKMRDDGSSEAAKRQVDHLEGGCDGKAASGQ